MELDDVRQYTYNFVILRSALIVLDIASQEKKYS